jgi:hypothetical protein
MDDLAQYGGFGGVAHDHGVEAVEERPCAIVAAPLRKQHEAGVSQTGREAVGELQFDLEIIRQTEQHDIRRGGVVELWVARCSENREVADRGQAREGRPTLRIAM